MHPEPRTAEVDGLPLVESGSGDRTLVLLHGFTGSADAWPRAALEPLEARLRVVRVDLPGHGASPVEPGDAAAWTVERTTLRLRHLAEHLGTPASWLGYSMGGRLALVAAVARVPMSALLLESASPGLREEEARRERRRTDGRLADELDALGPAGAGGSGFAAFVDRWMALPIFASQRGLPPGVLEGERERRKAGSPQGWAAALRGFGTGSQPSLWDDVRGVSVPLHLLVGADDARFVAIADRMLELRPGATRTIAAGTGHTIHLEAPVRWAEWVLERLV